MLVRLAILTLAFFALPTLGHAIEIEGASEARAICAHALPVSDVFVDEDAEAPDVSPVAVDCHQNDAAGAEVVEVTYVPTGPAAEAERAGYDVGEASGRSRTRTEGARAYSRRRSELLVSAHQATVDGNVFDTLPYDVELGVLTFSPPSRLELADGYALELVNDPQLEFSIEHESAEAIAAAQVMQDVEVRLVFELLGAQEPTLVFCSETDEGDMVIAGVLLAAELVQRESGDTLARLETDQYVASSVRWGGEPDGCESAARPTAEVTSLALEGDGEADGLGEDVEVVQYALESHLTECYLEGLAANARLQGAMVIGFEMDQEGHFHNPQLQIDALGCQLVTSCAMSELTRIQVPRSAPGGPLLIRATVTLRTEQEASGAEERD